WNLTLDQDGNSRIVVREGIPQDPPPRTLSTTAYDAIGKVWKTEDQYHGITENHYDDRGNLIETIYPDGTKTVQLYDIAGRVILSVNRYLPSQTEAVVATRTIYDVQGRVSQTQKISLDAHAITVTASGSGDAAVYRVTAAGGAGLTSVTNDGVDGNYW